MFEAAVSGARTDEIEGVEVVVRPALTAAALDVLEADGYLLGTPVALVLGTYGAVAAVVPYRADFPPYHRNRAGVMVATTATRRGTGLAVA